MAKLVRMFSSPYENEKHIALAKLETLIREDGLTFNDLATVIENADGEIEERKYTDADMLAATQAVKERAEKDAYEKARRERTGPPEFYDEIG